MIVGWNELVSHVVVSNCLLEVRGALVVGVYMQAMITRGLLGYDGRSSRVAETWRVAVFNFQNWEQCGVLLGNRLLRRCLLFIRHPLSLCVLPEHPLSSGFARCFLGLYLVYLHELFHGVRGDAVLW